MFNLFSHKMTPEGLSQEDKFLRLIHKARDWPVERLTLGQVAYILNIREYSPSALQYLLLIEEKLKTP